eukprot:GHVU01032951.1.p1 GENE.GHVU01032951.1~~GHVU01032951.1.p1  ORF type:complete len:815 (+),score=133.82 GHVU01032951.1:571-3015(+)
MNDLCLLQTEPTSSSSTSSTGNTVAGSATEVFEFESAVNVDVDDEGSILVSIKWRGYKTTTWEPLRNLAGNEDVIQECIKKNGLGRKIREKLLAAKEKLESNKTKTERPKRSRIYNAWVEVKGVCSCATKCPEKTKHYICIVPGCDKVDTDANTTNKRRHTEVQHPDLFASVVGAPKAVFGRSVSLEQKETLLRLFASWFICDSRPMNMLKDEGLSDIVTYLSNDNCLVPSAHLVGGAVNKLYVESKAAISAEIRDVVNDGVRLPIAGDIWTRNGLAILALVTYFIRENKAEKTYEMQEVLLDAHPFGKVPHTGEMIWDYTLDSLGSVGLRTLGRGISPAEESDDDDDDDLGSDDGGDSDSSSEVSSTWSEGEDEVDTFPEEVEVNGEEFPSILGLISDRGSNMLSAFSDEGAAHCVAHAVHNVVTALKKGGYFRGVCMKMSKVTKRLRKGYHVTERLEDAQLLVTNVPKKPPIVGGTRWLGLVELTAFFKQHQQSLQGMLILPPLGKRSKKDEMDLHQTVSFSVGEWDKVEELLRILLPLKDFTLDMQTTKEPMAQLLLPSTCVMIDELELLAAETEGRGQSEEAGGGSHEEGVKEGRPPRPLSAEARAVVRTVITNIYSRFQFGPTVLGKYLRATILSPHLRDLTNIYPPLRPGLCRDDAVRATAQEWTARFKSQVSTGQAIVAPTQTSGTDIGRRPSLSDKLGMRRASVAANGVPEDEFQQYLGEAAPDNWMTGAEVLKYWYNKQKVFPNLSKMARETLSWPATTGGVERLFSRASRGTGHLQRRKKESTLKKYLQVAANRALVKKRDSVK